MTKRDIERYVRQKTGVVTPGERDRAIENVIRYRTTDVDTAEFAPTGFTRGVQHPPGFQAGDVVTVTTAVSNRTQARYLGQAPADLIAITIRMDVTTAYVAGTWAEVGIGTSLDMTLGASADISLSGFVSVATTFNSTGIKDTEIAVNISRGQHVWLLWGSQGGTTYAVRGGLADIFSTGITQLATTTQPSTMADPTSFTVSSNASTSPWIAFQW